MKNTWNWIKNNPNRAMFLVPILLVAGISISHVVTWYDMTNPINWAIYLSVAIEVGAITALVAATNRIKGGIWFMFGIVTFIQMVGNIFYSYKEIDINGELFQSWVELTGPIWELTGTDLNDTVGMRRWLAFLAGGLLPIISLTSLHFFVKYEKPSLTKEEGLLITEEKVYHNTQEEEVIPQKPKPTTKQVDIDDDDEQPVLVEEENPEDNIWYDHLVSKNVGPLTEGREKRNFKENPPPQKTTPKPPPPITNVNETVGEKLSKTWGNVVKKRKNNNGISRLGE